MPTADEIADDLAFIDKALAGWALWAANAPGPGKPRAAGAVLNIASEREGEYTLKFTDDEFTRFDREIATLPHRFRQIIELEYRNVWKGGHVDDIQEAKWRRIGLGYTAYGARLAQAKEMLFKLTQNFLIRYIEIWRKRRNE